tara:strand:+ start:318 stop:1058 length:741 start_codon:yes stop_codon:yes gene_type:complete
MNLQLHNKINKFTIIYFILCIKIFVNANNVTDSNTQNILDEEVGEGRDVCNYRGSCSCDYGWGGSYCEGECPGGGEMPCTNNGLCLSNLTCACFEGWTGTSCQALCPMGTDDNSIHAQNTVCSSHGNCIVANDSVVNGTCTCHSGWRGDDCSLECPGGFETPCSENGICLDNNTCMCNENWVGLYCEVSKDSFLYKNNFLSTDGGKTFFFNCVLAILAISLIGGGCCLYKKCRKEQPINPDSVNIP